MWQKGVETFIDPFSLPIEAVFPLVVLVIVVYTAWYSYNYLGIALYSVLPLLLVPGIAVLILLVAGIAVLPLLAPGIAEQIGTPPLPSTVATLFSSQHILLHKNLFCCLADCLAAMSFVYVC